MFQPRLALALGFLALLGVSASADEKAKPDDKGKEIFNGKDLDGWIAEGATEYKDKADGGKVKPIWTAEDGLLRCAGNGYGFLRYDKQEYADFAFHVEYRMTKSTPICNSGIGIRTVPYDKKNDPQTRPSFYSYEIQLLDDSGKKPDKHGSGSLYRYVAPKENPVKPAGQWNMVDVECIGPHIAITINDKTIVDIDQTNIDPTKWDVDKSQLEELKKKPLKGYACLQVHGGKLDFRNIRIREIKAETGK
jgi:hypothetical protein